MRSYVPSKVVIREKRMLQKDGQVLHLLHTTPDLVVGLYYTPKKSSIALGMDEKKQTCAIATKKCSITTNYTLIHKYQKK